MQSKPETRVGTPQFEALADPTVAEVLSELDDLCETRLETFKRLVPYTPLVEVPNFAPGYECYAKDMSALPSGAYKEGIAANVLLKHYQTDRQPPLEGVVVASTGNFAAGTARIARLFRIPTVRGLCPASANAAKKRNMRANGMEVDDQYDTLDQALAAAQQEGEKPGWLFIHPYDDPAGIAANGVIGIEALEQLRSGAGIDPNDPNVEITLLATGGGGGLGAGLAVAAARSYPRVRVMVAQMEGGAGIADELEGNPSDPATFDYSCDGAAVPTPGRLPIAVFKALNIDVVRVSKGAVGKAMRELKRPLGKEVEPAGAVAAAAAQQIAENSPLPTPGVRRILVAVVSGANSTPAKLAEFRQAAFAPENTQRQAEFAQLSQQHLERTVWGVDQVVGSTALKHF